MRRRADTPKATRIVHALATGRLAPQPYEDVDEAGERRIAVVTPPAAYLDAWRREG